MSAPVRTASTVDLDAVMAIERASFPTDAWSTAMMRDALATADAFVAEDARGVVGYCAVLAPAGSGDADVLTIAVAQEARGEGTGAVLLARMVRVARERRARRLFLEVRVDNPAAQHLYVTRGFRVVGRRPRYYQPDGVDAIVMRLDLQADGEPGAGPPVGEGGAGPGARRAPPPHGARDPIDPTSVPYPRRNDMPDARRLVFGDHRDPREELDTIFATPGAQDGDERAAAWARGVLGRAGIPAASTLEVIAALRGAEPRLGLKSATYLATSLAR